MRALAAVLRKHPRLALSAEEAVVRRLERRLADGKLDVGLGYAPARAPDLDTEPVFDSRLAFVVARGHPLAGAESVGARQLANESFALLSRGLRVRARVDRTTHTGGGGARTFEGGRGVRQKVETRVVTDREARMRKLTLDDPMTRSADLVAGNVAKLKELFPEALTEGKIDFDVLKQLLGTAVDEREERYGLNWHGKRRARQLALTPSTGTLRPCPGESVDWDTTRNLFIEGDNLEVLKLLQKSYAGKIKLIYIDPPYNTGKDFVYPDDFQDNLKNYLELTGQVEGGRKLTSNTETSGRFHTDWLNMMYPRLLAARSLLREDGVIMISIDDKELHHLRALCNEIFGEESFVAAVTAVTNMKGRNDKKHVASCHEYLLIYSGQDFVSNGLPLTEEQNAAFKYVDEDGNRYALRDLRKRGGPDRREDRPRMFFPIYWNKATDTCSLERESSTDFEILPRRGDGTDGSWRWGKEKVGKHIKWLKARQSERSGRLDIEHRVYLDPAMERTSKPKSVWLGGEFSSDSGKRALKELLPGDTFDFPKSVDFIRTCVLLGSSDDDIVLDFFAGSATTGQAVMTQNGIDGGRRRYILVQLPEPLDPNNREQRDAAAFCESLGRPPHLSELTKERLRRADKKLNADTSRGTTHAGFRVFKLDSSNIRGWEPNRDNLEKSLLDSVEHIKEERTPDDILYEVLLKLGLELCVPIEQRTIAGKTVHSVGGGVLMACLEEKINRGSVERLALGIAEWHEELAPSGETTCVFRDSAFADDVARSNLAAILEQHGLSKVTSL
jgi:adenine-specific DNA-methyltransferase